ncbi:MAG: hypothetical protein U1A72_09220 [Sulfuritalea sp.]|nr:hypothetical protein [Sulfuritalea sp.]
MNQPDWAVLPFLGSRNYLHGTTLYRHLCGLVPTDSAVCFRITNVIRSNRVRVWSSADDGAPANTSARLDWSCIDGRSGIMLVEEGDLEQPLNREAYDEAFIVSDSAIEGKVIRYHGESPFDTVATAVPMFKAILKANDLTPSSGGQWMFTRLDACRIHQGAASIELLLEQARPRFVAKCSVLVNDKSTGSMYFSWVKLPA